MRRWCTIYIICIKIYALRINEVSRLSNIHHKFNHLKINLGKSRVVKQHSLPYSTLLYTYHIIIIKKELLPLLPLYAGNVHIFIHLQIIKTLQFTLTGCMYYDFSTIFIIQTTIPFVLFIDLRIMDQSINWCLVDFYIFLGSYSIIIKTAFIASSKPSSVIPGGGCKRPSRSFQLTWSWTKHALGPLLRTLPLAGGSCSVCSILLPFWIYIYFFGWLGQSLAYFSSSHS